MALFVTEPVRADNAAYQQFFLAVCQNPSGALADRCAETPGAQGALSGNSQSSLNPTQGLALPATLDAVGSARDRQLRNDLESSAPATGFVLDQGPVSVLVNLRTGWDRLDRAQNTPTNRGFDAERYAIEMGLDARINERLVLGLLGALERSTLEFGPGAPGPNFTPVQSSGSIDTDARVLIAYADWTFGASAYLDVLLSLSDDDIRFERNAEFQEIRRVSPQVAVRTRGDTSGQRAALAAVVGSEIARGAVAFGYSAGLTAARTTVADFAERDQSASGLAMRFDEIEQDSVLGHIGLSVSRSTPFAGGVLVPHIRAEYQHAFKTERDAGAATFLGDSAANEFAFTGEPSDRNQVIFAAGVTCILPNGWLPFVSVESLFGVKDLSQYRLVAGLRREW